MKSQERTQPPARKRGGDRPTAAGERHSSAPMGRKREPMLGDDPPIEEGRAGTRTRGHPDAGLAPDEDT